MSCSEPRPLSRVAVAPPSSSTGDCAICAFFTAVTALVTPGPAVTAATPTVPVIRATASAANTALASSRTSTTRNPRACAPVRIGEMWPPHSVNRWVTPWRARTSAMMSPPWVMARSIARHNVGLEGRDRIQCYHVSNLASSTADTTQASNLILYAIPAFVIAVVAEVLWARRHRDDSQIRGYELRDSAASMTLGLINVVVSGFTKLLSIPFFAWLYLHRVADIGTAWWAWIVLLLGEDLCYYWFHRVHHEVRLLWACHVNHHSSQRFNLSTALRQPLLTPLSGPIFWAP